MGLITTIAIGQLAIVVTYCLALTRLSRIESHAMVFAACFVLSIALSALVFDIPDGIKEAEWNLAALASVGIFFVVSSLAMLLGSLASWRVVSRTSYSISAQISIAAIIGLASFFLGAILGFFASLFMSDFHI